MADQSGSLVPLVMIPRFTTYVGAGDYATAPLDVSAYGQAILTFWRGLLIDKTVPPGGSGATFTAHIEESHDAYEWTPIGSPITADDTSTNEKPVLSKRWFRMRVVLTPRSDDNMAAITCWAVGSLVRRVP